MIQNLYIKQWTYLGVFNSSAPKGTDTKQLWPNMWFDPIRIMCDPSINGRQCAATSAKWNDADNMRRVIIEEQLQWSAAVTRTNVTSSFTRIPCTVLIRRKPVFEFRKMGPFIVFPVFGIALQQRNRYNITLVQFVWPLRGTFDLKWIWRLIRIIDI